MTFEEILDQAIAMLQRRGRMTYRTLQRQFTLDEDALNDLKDELLYAHPEVRDDAGRGLAWTRDPGITASHAALAMQPAMRGTTEEVRRSCGLELRMRVGLNSGEVVVRAIGNDLHMDYSAVGETTHLAARMEQLATPGTIRLTAATLRLVDGLVQVTALGPVPVKGLAEPVEGFALVGGS